MSTQLYRLATVGAPRGLKGEVRLNLHTDNPQERLTAGTRVTTSPDIGELVISDLIYRAPSWYVRFEGRPDRTAVEPLVHTVLLAEGSEEPEAWYSDELKGLRVQDLEGNEIGVVADVQNYPAQDLLVVKEKNGTQALIPFVKQIVPSVDIEVGIVVVDAPHGLLSGDEEQ